MFGLRPKIGLLRNNEWRCCFCLHVRTATIILGIWHLILHVLALTVLALIMRNNRIVVQRSQYGETNLLPTPLSKIKEEDRPQFMASSQDGQPVYSSDVDMGALMTVCTLSITLLMVYGAIKGKATHLLPFFCLQVFDCVITLLSAAGYLCYMKSIHHLVAEQWGLPFRHTILQLNTQVLNLMVVIGFILSMLWKTYWIHVVWRCYRYLCNCQQTMRNAIHYILPEGSDRINESDYPSFFPDHEAAFGSSLKQTPPPSYQDIMEDQPPPYPTSLQETPYHWRLLAFYPSTSSQSEAQLTSAVVNEEGTAGTSTSRVEVTAESQGNVDSTEETRSEDTVTQEPKAVEEEEEAEGAVALPVEVSNKVDAAVKAPANLKF